MTSPWLTPPSVYQGALDERGRTAEPDRIQVRLSPRSSSAHSESMPSEGGRIGDAAFASSPAFALAQCGQESTTTRGVR